MTLRTCSPPGSSILGFSRQEYWSGLPFPSPGDLPDPGIEHVPPASAGRFFTTEPPGKPSTFSDKAKQVLKKWRVSSEDPGHNWSLQCPVRLPHSLPWFYTTWGVGKSVLATREKEINWFCVAYWSLLAKYPTHMTFSSVAQSCLTLCNPLDCSTPGLPVHRQLLDFTQTHVHWVSDIIQPSHPLSAPSPPAFNPSQHQGLF